MIACNVLRTWTHEEHARFMRKSKWRTISQNLFFPLRYLKYFGETSSSNRFCTVWVCMCVFFLFAAILSKTNSKHWFKVKKFCSCLLLVCGLICLGVLWLILIVLIANFGLRFDCNFQPNFFPTRSVNAFPLIHAVYWFICDVNETIYIFIISWRGNKNDLVCKLRNIEISSVVR